MYAHTCLLRVINTGPRQAHIHAMDTIRATRYAGHVGFRTEMRVGVAHAQVMGSRERINQTGRMAVMAAHVLALRFSDRGRELFGHEFGPDSRPVTGAEIAAGNGSAGCALDGNAKLWGWGPKPIGHVPHVPCRGPALCSEGLPCVIVGKVLDVGLQFHRRITPNGVDHVNTE